VVGPTTTVTGKFVSVGMTPNYLDPEEITQLDANGDLCLDDQGRPQFRWIDLSMVICLVDPTLINILTGDPLVVDDVTPTPNTTGYRIDAATTGTASFALEIWTGKPGQSCTAAGFSEYGYWLFPFVVQATWQEQTFENGPLNLTINARTQAGAGWGIGPYNVLRDATVPATLEPLRSAITGTQHLHHEITTVPPPAAVCGAVALP